MEQSRKSPRVIREAIIKRDYEILKAMNEGSKKNGKKICK
jgi:hypothetical protein